MKDYEKTENCNDRDCKYFDGNMELNCSYSEDNSKCCKIEAQKEQLDIPVVIPSVTKKGFVQCMDRETLWVNTQNDALVIMHIKDKETRWQLYCKHVKVTIEVIDETDLD